MGYLEVTASVTRWSVVVWWDASPREPDVSAQTRPLGDDFPRGR